MNLSSAVFFLAGFFLVIVAAKTTQSDVSKPSQGSVNDGKIVMHQLCNSGMAKAEVSSLKKEVEMLRKVLTQRLDKNGTKVLSVRVTLLGKQVETLGKALKQQLDQIQQKDSWVKLNTAPVCFSGKGDQFGKFSVPSGGSLIAIKLVHLHGYVACDTRQVYYWSYWGCGTHRSYRDQVNVVITTTTNRVLLPPSQFITDGTHKWSKIPGYNSLSRELVLSVFSSPLTVTSGQVLRLWYGEDLARGSGDRDNGGTSCCDVFASFM